MIGDMSAPRSRFGGRNAQSDRNAAEVPAFAERMRPHHGRGGGALGKSG
jgi:hypothetical protein